MENCIDCGGTGCCPECNGAGVDLNEDPDSWCPWCNGGCACPACQGSGVEDND